MRGVFVNGVFLYPSSMCFGVCCVFAAICPTYSFAIPLADFRLSIGFCVIPPGVEFRAGRGFQKIEP